MHGCQPRSLQCVALGAGVQASWCWVAQVVLSSIEAVLVVQLELPSKPPAAHRVNTFHGMQA
jgi:hypothetical protein